MLNFAGTLEPSKLPLGVFRPNVENHNSSKIHFQRSIEYDNEVLHLTWRCWVAQMPLLLHEQPPLHLTNTGQTLPVASPNLDNTERNSMPVTRGGICQVLWKIYGLLPCVVLLCR